MQKRIMQSDLNTCWVRHVMHNTLAININSCQLFDLQDAHVSSPSHGFLWPQSSVRQHQYCSQCQMHCLPHQRWPCHWEVSTRALQLLWACWVPLHGGTAAQGVPLKFWLSSTTTHRVALDHPRWLMDEIARYHNATRFVWECSCVHYSHELF